MLNNDGELDEEEKARIAHHYIGRKLKLCIFTIGLLFVLEVGLLLKGAFGEVAAMGWCIVATCGLFFGVDAYEKHDRNKHH